MSNSLLKKEQFNKEIQKANFISRAFLIASIIILISTAIISYYIVQVKGEESIMIAELLVESEGLRINTEQWKQNLKIAEGQRINPNLATYLPTSDDYTHLTRLFDDLFEQWDTPSNPIIGNSLVYGRSAIDEGNDLAVLPVTLAVTSSVENFAKLLATLEASGLPDSNFRLIDIQSIALNLSSNTDDNTISYTLSLNAYFQAS